MQNYKQPGKILTLTAPYARSAGQGALVGAIFGVACSDVENAVAGEFQVEGVFTLTKVGSQGWAVGDKIYWDNGNKRCTTDATAGMLIGVATAIVASGAGDTTGNVRLNGNAPSTLEGPQAAEADLTDNSGGTTADGTIAVVTAPTALTDNGGGTADATVAAQAAPVTITDSTGQSGSHSDTIDAAAAGACAGSGSPSATNVDTAIATALAPLVINDSSLGQKLIELVTLAGVAQNNLHELTTRQGENRAAIVALTDAVKELSTKQNALLAKLRIAGIIASS